MSKPLPSADLLRAKFYICEEGLVRRISSGVVLGSLRKPEVRTAIVGGEIYSVRRLAFKMQTGREPTGDVRFIDPLQENYNITNLEERARKLVGYSGKASCSERYGETGK